MGCTKLLECLSRGHWHTTSVERYRGILESDAILPEPNVSDQDRWKTGRGPEYYPLVRSLGGVSLFEFGNVDLERYSETHPCSTWREFVPFRKAWGCSIWIQVKTDAANLISANELIDLWEVKRFHRHAVMPRIEAAHLGPIPATAFLKVLQVSAMETKVLPLPRRSLVAVLSRLNSITDEISPIAELAIDAIDL